MAKNNNFTVINKQAQELWNDASYGVVKETSRRISEAEKAMSGSQKKRLKFKEMFLLGFFKILKLL